MTLDEYQVEALKTAKWTGDDFKDICHMVLGTVGESGEIAEKLKKIIRDLDGTIPETSKPEFAKEIGDVLWYLASLSHILGYTLDDVAQMNVQKLRDRQSRNVIIGSGDNR